MTTSQPSTPYPVRRVAARAGVGLWRNRGAVLLGAFAAFALVGYVSMTWTGALPALSGASTAASTNSDCADTAMAAIADKSPAVTQRAYQCMDASFQQRVTEQAFTQQMQTARVASGVKLARITDYRTPSGGTMVYYALNSGAQSVGYIVYLGQNGKVLKIQ